MTLNELKNSVVDLGFEMGLDREEMLIPALSRALYTIYMDRPRLKTVMISAGGDRGRLLAKHIYHEGGEVINYKLSGIAYSFRVSGIGSYVITMGATREEHSFDGDMTVVRGKLSTPGSISFLGEYAYDIYSLAEFSSTRGPRLSDIPIYGEERSYSLEDICPDYLGSYSLPKTGTGAIIRGSDITGGIMHLPYTYRGEVLLTYKRAPYVASGDDMEERIDIPREVDELLPLLVASYLWLDDDADKAQYYMSLYRSGMATVQRSGSGEFVSEYATNGWA